MLSLFFSFTLLAFLNPLMASYIDILRFGGLRYFFTQHSKYSLIPLFYSSHMLFFPFQSLLMPFLLFYFPFSVSFTLLPFLLSFPFLYCTFYFNFLSFTLLCFFTFLFIHYLCLLPRSLPSASSSSDLLDQDVIYSLSQHVPLIILLVPFSFLFSVTLFMHSAFFMGICFTILRFGRFRRPSFTQHSAYYCILLIYSFHMLPYSLHALYLRFLPLSSPSASLSYGLMHFNPTALSIFTHPIILLISYAFLSFTVSSDALSTQYLMLSFHLQSVHMHFLPSTLYSPPLAL